MNKKLSKITAIGVTGLSTLMLDRAVASANTPKDWIGGLIGKGGSDLQSLIVKILNWGIGAGALAAVAFLVVAGFMYITANGDETKIGKATKTLTFAIVGLVVCFIAVLLVNFVLVNFLDQTAA